MLEAFHTYFFEILLTPLRNIYLRYPANKIFIAISNIYSSVRRSENYYRYFIVDKALPLLKQQHLLFIIEVMKVLKN